jgi:hypothetical protein
VESSGGSFPESGGVNRVLTVNSETSGNNCDDEGDERDENEKSGVSVARGWRKAVERERYYANRQKISSKRNE